ncbi:hypothetical protein D3C76_1407740 [compost metagenome]
MLPQRRANMPGLRQTLRKLQRTSHLRLGRAIATRYVGHQLPRLQLRMTERFSQAQHWLDTRIQLCEQRAQLGKVMLFEFDLQRVLKLLLMRQLR